MDKYRLIIIAVIVIAFLFFRLMYPSLKKAHEHSSQNTQKHTSNFNRNNVRLILIRACHCRMECRDITEDEIKQILHNGNINDNESDLHNERRATYALEGYIHDHQHLQIVFAPKSDELVVVACIDLDKEWQCDCN